jgi:hypothetical protein
MLEGGGGGGADVLLSAVANRPRESRVVGARLLSVLNNVKISIGAVYAGYLVRSPVIGL